MALSIKLVRHGESQANVGIVNTWEVGDHTVELTAKGHEQARGAGASIGADFFAGAIAYSSPFRRARDTLDGLLLGAGIDRSTLLHYEDPRLREVDHGYVSIDTQRAAQTKYGPFYYRFQGGESPADCYDRTSGFLESMMRQVLRVGAERVLIVTHGLTIRCFVMRFLHLTVEQFESMANPGNCAVATLAARDTVADPVFATGRWAVTGIQLVKRPSSG
jgi:broad specificity phosphatase PhoE